VRSSSSSSSSSSSTESQRYETTKKQASDLFLALQQSAPRIDALQLRWRQRRTHRMARLPFTCACTRAAVRIAAWRRSRTGYPPV